MFSAQTYKSMYSRLMGPLAQPVTLMINNGTGWDSYTGVMAHVSKYQESDLVSGGSIQLGDIRLVILNEDIPVEIDRLDSKDRIEIDGRAYGVIHWDSHTRSVGDETIAVESAVRG